MVNFVIVGFNTWYSQKIFHVTSWNLNSIQSRSVFICILWHFDKYALQVTDDFTILHWPHPIYRGHISALLGYIFTSYLAYMCTWTTPNHNYNTATKLQSFLKEQKIFDRTKLSPSSGQNFAFIFKPYPERWKEIQKLKYLSKPKNDFNLSY